ncbi:CatB-related O-acetyltransferase [Pseudosulfitobacter sp. SM2401]|uniref:CatB-related O-acetyltransferase n=1 Tax=Pseudosulfitobacter sp. SM2401 TaxID=3350098 RepID=UPI0036F29E1A
MLPPPETLYPVTLPDGSSYAGTVFLANALRHPNIHVGDYTYFSTFEPAQDPADYAARLAPYLFEGAKDCIRIGKFCQIAHGTRIITTGANHAMTGFSTYPFPIFEADRIGAYSESFPKGRDVVIGHDCWLSDSCTILPGAQLGNGVIVGAGAVVGGVVPDYAVVVGNPAKVLRMRFDPDTIANLNALAWWHWPREVLTQHEALIVGRDVQALLDVGKSIHP